MKTKPKRPIPPAGSQSRAPARSESEPQRTHRHHLFHGEVFDIPGHSESWDEYVRYCNDNRWELIIESNNLDGMAPAPPPQKERFGTKALVNWVLDRDAEIEDRHGHRTVDEDDSDDNESQRELGPRGNRLLEIANCTGATYCATRLDGWVSGTWPSEPPVRIRSITGVAMRGVWIRISHPVYTATTNRGPAFLYPPGPDRIARVILTTESAHSAGRKVAVPKPLMGRIESLKPALEALAAGRGNRSR